MRNTRFWSGHFMRVWKPTRLYAVGGSFSARSCTTACGRLPVRGSVRPTGFMQPNDSVR